MFWVYIPNSRQLVYQGWVKPPRTILTPSYPPTLADSRYPDHSSAHGTNFTERR